MSTKTKEKKERKWELSTTYYKIFGEMKNFSLDMEMGTICLQMKNDQRLIFPFEASGTYFQTKHSWLPAYLDKKISSKLSKISSELKQEKIFCLNEDVAWNETKKVASHANAWGLYWYENKKMKNNLYIILLGKIPHWNQKTLKWD